MSNLRCKKCCHLTVGLTSTSYKMNYYFLISTFVQNGKQSASQIAAIFELLHCGQHCCLHWLVLHLLQAFLVLGIVWCLTNNATFEINPTVFASSFFFLDANAIVSDTTQAPKYLYHHNSSPKFGHRVLLQSLDD